MLRGKPTFGDQVLAILPCARPAGSHTFRMYAPLLVLDFNKSLWASRCVVQVAHLLARSMLSIRCTAAAPALRPPHNQPDSRMEPPKGSSSICRVSKGTGDLARVRCQLETRDLWTKFNELGTEMIITKSGR
ncbi:unnamed protein product [Schistocephalus solidus]|uniref:T-box domain-containing protein n=1 Tax=Schistocephalus solidus TaxID=70667 RepID=A0A183T9L4_SCHSO|nr:unnamed protein product [Schistocephalus solidus]